MKYLIGFSFALLCVFGAIFFLSETHDSVIPPSPTPYVDRQQELSYCSEWARLEAIEEIKNTQFPGPIPDPKVLIPQLTRICMNQKGLDY